MAPDVGTSTLSRLSGCGGGRWDDDLGLSVSHDTYRRVVLMLLPASQVASSRWLAGRKVAQLLSMLHFVRSLLFSSLVY